MSFSLLAATTDVQSPWTSQPLLSQVEFYDIPSSTSFETRIPLTVVVLKNSQWTLENVKARLARTEEIFAQCGLSFSPITLISAEHPSLASWHSDSYESYFDFSLLAPSSKPIVFMIEDDAKKWYGAGFSINQRLIKESPSSFSSGMVNTSVLIYSEASAQEKSVALTKSLERGKYEVMAHELGHLLFNEKHSYEYDNLMSEMRFRNNSITESQCQKAREFKGI